MANQITLTDEQLAKVIAAAILGYSTGVLGVDVTNEEVKKLYETTLEGINEEIPGELPFVLDFVNVYDNQLDAMRAEAKMVYKQNHG